MTKLIAITGKTGVGKTYLLKKYNYPKTINLDNYVKNTLYHQDHPVFAKIVSIFGTQIITKNKIDTSRIGKIVLNDFDKLEILASIVNPYIRTYLQSLENNIYLIEIAIYLKYENYFKDIFKKVILITSQHIYLQNKFTYMNKKIEIIKNIDIKYDYIINRDQINSEILFFKLLDKLLAFK